MVRRYALLPSVMLMLSLRRYRSSRLFDCSSRTIIIVSDILYQQSYNFPRTCLSDSVFRITRSVQPLIRGRSSPNKQNPPR